MPERMILKAFLIPPYLVQIIKTIAKKESRSEAWVVREVLKANIDRYAKRVK